MTKENNNTSDRIFEDPDDEDLSPMESLGAELDAVVLRKAYLKLRDKAYEYLARREHSRHELAQKLQRFDEQELAEELLKDLIEQDAQSDQRYAEQLGRARYNAGKGPRVLQQELSQHKIDPVIIEEIMEHYSGQWQTLAEQVRIKKFGDAAPEDYAGWAKQARFLRQRGFSAREIPPFRD